MNKNKKLLNTILHELNIIVCHRLNNLEHTIASLEVTIDDFKLIFEVSPKNGYFVEESFVYSQEILNNSIRDFVNDRSMRFYNKVFRSVENEKKSRQYVEISIVYASVAF